MYSNCCGASEWMEGTDICSNCKEHAEFDEDEDVISIKKENYMNNYRNGCRGCNCMTELNCKNKL